MKNRNRRVPPPPPPPPPPASSGRTPSLPVPRPRHLGSANVGSRTDRFRRAVRLPAPPTDWPLDLDAGDTRPAPTRLPEPPEGLRDGLRNLTRTFTPPVPPADLHKIVPSEPQAKASLSATRPELKDFAKRLNVPVICTEADRAFVLVFREKRSVFGTRYKLEATLANIGENGAEPSPSLTVPISSLDWGGITCPHCRNRSRVRPVLCGACNRLACDGRVTESSDDLFFKCADSCGTSGWVRNSLKTVTGTDGGRSAPQTAASSLICAPEMPSGIPPKLPKPR